MPGDFDQRPAGRQAATRTVRCRRGARCPRSSSSMCRAWRSDRSACPGSGPGTRPRCRRRRSPGPWWEFLAIGRRRRPPSDRPAGRPARRASRGCKRRIRPAGRAAATVNRVSGIGQQPAALRRTAGQDQRRSTFNRLLVGRVFAHQDLDCRAADCKLEARRGQMRSVKTVRPAAANRRCHHRAWTSSTRTITCWR